MSFSKTMNAVGGSMNIARRPERLRKTIHQRQFLTNDLIAPSVQAPNSNITPCGAGSQYAYRNILFNGNLCSDEAKNWIKRHDQYTISEVEVFASVTFYNESNSFVEGTSDSFHVRHYCCVAPDVASNLVPEWSDLRDRQNLSQVVLRPSMPQALIAKFTPRPKFPPASSGNSANNMIGQEGQYIDAQNLEQEFSGLKCWSVCPRRDFSNGLTTSKTYYYKVNYSIRLTVKAKTPV